MKTKVAVLYEFNTPLKVEEVTLDDPQANEVLVKLAACGVCHTDLGIIKGEAPIVPMPMALGHEGAGVVEKVGPGVTTLQPGDHVALSVAFTCGQCRDCVEGRPTLCPANLLAMALAVIPISLGMRLHIGDQYIHPMFGLAALAEYTVVHERACVKIREDAPFDAVSLLGCGAATGIGSATNSTGLRPGETIAIWGTGGVGLAAVMGAKLAGAGKIIAVDTIDKKLEMAKELGADHVINASKEDPVAKVHELTGGGADYAIETAGKIQVKEQAFGSIRMGGTCVLIGMTPMGETMTIDPAQFMLGKTLTGNIEGEIRPHVDIPRYVDLFMDGKLPLDKLVSHRFSLDQVNEAFSALEKGEVIRGVVQL